MNPTEQSAKSSSVSMVSLLAMLGGLFRIEGGGARLSARRLGLALVATGLVLALAGPIAPALAKGPPNWGVPPKYPPVVIVHSTRVSIKMELFTEELSTKWKAEYTLAGANCEPPVKETGCSWTVSNSGVANEEGGITSSASVYIEDKGVAWLRHLAPATSYYARFIAENADSTEPAVEIIPFKTLPVEKPEVDWTLEGGQEQYNTFRHAPNTELTDTSAVFSAVFDANGAEASYSFEYAPAEAGGGRPGESSASWKVFTSNGAGTISAGTESVAAEAHVEDLVPETTYYVRIKLKNGKGERVQTKYEGYNEELESFTTGTARPSVDVPGARNVTADSAYLTGGVLPRGSETHWRFEYAPSALGPWSLVPGSGDEGTISQVEAEATPYNAQVTFGVKLVGLSASTPYYVRMFAENVCTVGHVGCGEGLGPHNELLAVETHDALSFVTAGAPSATTFATHALHGESLRLLGAVNPNSLTTSAEQLITVEGVPTGGTFTLTFKGATTAPIVFDASAEDIREALQGLPSEPLITVTGPDGGPYTVYFFGPDGGVAQPPIEASGLGLTPASTVSAITTQPGGVAYDTHYHFEYVAQKQFESEGGWAQASSTVQVDLGSGDSSEVVGVDLPSLTAGESYRYRIVAVNTAPGTSSVYGAEQTLTVPQPSSPTEEASACQNEAFRTGLSAHLPDCRAYEQLTPVDKESAQEPFNYGTNLSSAVHVGEDGEHAALDATGVNWGGGPEAGQSPYLFSREPGRGWSLTAGAPQPQTGVGKVEPQVYNADLTQVAFAYSYHTSLGSESPDVAYEVGLTGGPYTMVASVPRGEVPAGKAGGWIASSADFSKLVLESEDHVLVAEEPTGTKSGSDLYEYTSSGGLRQLNVDSEGVTIGRCGARLVHGVEEGAVAHLFSGPHSLSTDGSRVFFEAVPGSNCSEPAHLYMRVNGTETVDIGVYVFLAASATGSEVLLEKTNGETNEIVLYDTEGASSTTTLFTTHTRLLQAPAFDVASQGAHLTALYFASPEQLTAEAPSVSKEDVNNTNAGNLYGYDVATRTLHFVLKVADATGGSPIIQSVTPDGRYAYLNPRVIAGVPGGGLAVEGGYNTRTLKKSLSRTVQIYRYDGVENIVECVSCTSTFDSEPKLPAFLNGSDGIPFLNGGLPDYTAVSANGEFVFFTTPAALVRQDIDEEILIPKEGSGTDIGGTTSPSSDVYEWRERGVDGCGQMQGCLALITSGRGGYLNLLLGTSPYVNSSGETVEAGNVFVYTRSQLLAQDNDTSGDIYNVRIDGGFAPPPPRPTECEGDACSSPPSAPNDATPSSLTFNGTGNVTPSVSSASKTPVKKTTKKKTKPKKKKVHANQHKAKKHAKAVKKSKSARGGK